MAATMNIPTSSSTVAVQYDAAEVRSSAHRRKRTQEMAPSVELDRYVPRSILEWFFFGYYVFQIVTTLILDMQGTLPRSLYPSWIRAIHTHHLETWRDPWLANTLDSPWYLSICIWEYLLHIPFFFVAAKAYYNRIKGVDRCCWIRIPLIMYCTQMVTAVSGVLFMALMADFSHSPYLAPTNVVERVKLAGLYGLFFVICALNLWDAVTSKSYQQQQQHRRQD